MNTKIIFLKWCTCNVAIMRCDWLVINRHIHRPTHQCSINYDGCTFKIELLPSQSINVTQGKWFSVRAMWQLCAASCFLSAATLLDPLANILYHGMCAVISSCCCHNQLTVGLTKVLNTMTKIDLLP